MDGKLLNFDTELFNQPVTVAIGDLDIALNFLREKMSAVLFEKTETHMRQCDGYALQADTGGGVHNFIWVNDFLNVNTLFHEALHTAFNILDWVGVPADADSQEAVAYLQSWLVKRIRTLYESDETNAVSADTAFDAKLSTAAVDNYWGCRRAVGRK